MAALGGNEKTMTANDDITTLERNGWKALSTSKAAAEEFYGAVLAEDARMLFPGGIQLAGKRAILDALAAQPWKSFELNDVHEFALGGNVRGLTYRVIANRTGQDEYEAIISSVYVQIEGHWKLALHQQTPAQVAT